MYLTWEAISTLIAALSALAAVFFFGIRQATIKGKHEERMNVMFKQLATHDLLIAEHTAQLAEQAGSFKAINVTLGFIKDLLTKVSERLDRHCEKDE